MTSDFSNISRTLKKSSKHSFLIMNKSSLLFLLVLALFVTSACKQKTSLESEYENIREYQAILYEAEQAPITELVTPEGFRVGMCENEFEERLATQESSVLDSLKKDNESLLCGHYEWLLGNVHYAGDTSYPKDFSEGKLCSYSITLKGRLVKDEFITLDRKDVQTLCDFYKTFLKKDYTFKSLPNYLGDQAYVFTKSNMAITIVDKIYPFNSVEVTYENRPASAPIEKERQEAYRSKQSESSSSTTVSSVEVKNNKWNGGVKQVEDYLERTLRDPDSYESIEWSEVKRKDDGYYVRHKYRAKNGFGGYVTTNQLFHLDFSGHVVDVKDLY